MNAAATHRVRMIANAPERTNCKTWTVWFSISKTGKAMSKAEESKATFMSHEQATALRDRLAAEQDAAAARLSKKAQSRRENITYTYEVI